MKPATLRPAPQNRDYALPVARSRPIPSDRVVLLPFTSTATAFAVPASLYIVAATLLLFNIGGHPGFAYNWENYTAWGLLPFWDRGAGNLFHITQGLMTDSGSSPLVVLPAWLGFKIAGVGVVSMRVPIALIAALAIPLTWAVGRRLAGNFVGLLAAALLALSPVFLLYARTATDVGISLVPALACIYCLVRVLQQPGQWGWLAVLQAMLVLDSYAYAPIRFLWPISLALIAFELFRRQDQRRAILVSLAVTATVLPAALLALDTNGDYHGQPVEAIGFYFHGRGEQLANLSASRDETARFLSQARGADTPGSDLPADTTTLAWQLTLQNGVNLLNLLVDHHTLPAITDYWNPRGRLYPLLLVPFFLVGFALSLRRCISSLESRVLLALFLGFSLPLLITSGVHIGRLIFTLPFLFLLVALGFQRAATLAARLLAKRHPDPAEKAHPAPLRFLLPVASTLLLALVAWLSWQDYRIDPPLTHEAQVVPLLRQAAPELASRGAGAVLVASDLSEVKMESINTTEYRLQLDKVYRFVDLSQNPSPRSDPRDPRPPLYTGGLLDLTGTPEAIPGFCSNTYFVEPSLKDRFLGSFTNWRRACDRPPTYIILPN